MITITEALDQAWQYQRAGDVRQAEQLCRQILQVDATQAGAWHLLAVLASQSGQPQVALQCLDQAVALQPDAWVLRHAHGVACEILRRFPEAAASYQQALALNPGSAETYFRLGHTLKAQGKGTEAIAAYQQALRLQPAFPEAYNNLGNLYLSQGDAEQAAAYCRQALQLEPESPTALVNLGNALLSLGQVHEASAHFQRALAVKPDFAEAHYNLGSALRRTGQTAAALDHYREAVRLRPNQPEMLNNLGTLLAEQRRFVEALGYLQEGVRLQPDSPQFHTNLGTVLLNLGRMEEAAAECREALRLNPRYVQAFTNLGAILTALGRLDEALAVFADGLALEPRSSDILGNRGLALLLRGDYERGWIEYEHRWHASNFPRRSFTQPLWDGSPLAGRTILLHAEQGLGDTLHFVRYAPLVQQRGGRVVVECQPALLALLESCAGIDQLMGRGSPLPPFDVQAPLLSLPRILGTTLATVPATIPYLVARPELIEHWRRELAGVAAFKVGIFWRGSPTYQWDWRRSVPLHHFEPVARVAGVQLFSLQKGLGIEELRSWPAEIPIVDLGTRLDESTGAFMDTAAVTKNLDLVITADTAIGHLAGALGAPVWLALPDVPDWRWMLQREDSPWYPTIRLFRQHRQGDWDEVFQRMAAVLATRLG